MKIVSIAISKKKGTRKTVVEEVVVVKDHFLSLGSVIAEVTLWTARA